MAVGRPGGHGHVVDGEQRVVDGAPAAHGGGHRDVQAGVARGRHLEGLVVVGGGRLCGTHRVQEVAILNDGTARTNSGSRAAIV